jgi:hypothetical protein
MPAIPYLFWLAPHKVADLLLFLHINATSTSSQKSAKIVINIDKGHIIGYNNNRVADNDWYFSKVIYLQLQLALKEAGRDISQFNLKRWFGINVSNDKTKSVALKIL